MTAEKKRKTSRRRETAESGARIVEARPIDERPERPNALARVEGLGDTGRFSATSVAFLGTFAAHALVGLAAAASLVDMRDFTSSVLMHVSERLHLAYDVDVAPPPPPPPEPEPEPEPEPVKEPEPPQPTAVPEASAPPTNEPPAPAAAEAGKVLTAEPDPNEPLDLTGEGFLSGNGDRFSGGVTAANGTAKKAVRNTAAVPTGVPGGQGVAPAPAPAKDLSRAAKPIGGLQCSDLWPPDTDLNVAKVRVMVNVTIDGRAKDVTILDDPGDGFGAAARRCIMSRGRFDVGMDSAGRPLAKPTAPFVIRFQR